MKRIIIVVLMCMVFPCAGFCEDIQWKSYDEGVRLSKQENKKVFLYFRTDWCGYCAKMERQTFKDARVIEFLNAHYIAIKVDGDREKKVAKYYKVKGYPGNRFLDSRQKQIFQLPGFHQSETFLFFLEYLRSDSYKTMTPQQYYQTL